jgi:uncharacterized membrane protein (UPF0127 family)
MLVMVMIRNLRTIKILLVLTLVILPKAAAGATFDKGYSLVGSHLFEVELANDPTQRQIGLSKRGLNKNKYFMVFIFDYPQKVDFWMKDTKIDLDIAFIDSNNKINEISFLKANSLKRKMSKSNDILYALEVPKGFFKKNNILVGDDFQLFK